jgi:transposase
VSLTDVSYPVVRAYVAKRRPEINRERGRGEPGAFISQTHLPGRDAEVDFGEIGVRLRSQLITCHLFALRMSYSGKAVHRASAAGGQEAFFEGHVHAFEVPGGVPAGKIRYDNLKRTRLQVNVFQLAGDHAVPVPDPGADRPLCHAELLGEFGLRGWGAEEADYRCPYVPVVATEVAAGDPLA